MQKKKGISLIVLVITIIVMIILAASIILSLTSNNIVDRAEEAVDTSNLKQVQELAQMGWAEAYMSGKTTKTELETYINEYLSRSGLSDNEIAKYNIDVTLTGVTVNKRTEPLNNDIWRAYDIYDIVYSALFDDMISSQLGTEIKLYCEFTCIKFESIYRNDTLKEYKEKYIMHALMSSEGIEVPEYIGLDDFTIVSLNVSSIEEGINLITSQEELEAPITRDELVYTYILEFPTSNVDDILTSLGYNPTDIENEYNNLEKITVPAEHLNKTYQITYAENVVDTIPGTQLVTYIGRNKVNELGDYTITVSDGSDNKAIKTNITRCIVGKTYEDSYYIYTGIPYGYISEPKDKTLTAYGSILEKVNGENVIGSSFSNCVNLIEAPKIPKYAWFWEDNFSDCTSLKVAPEIPEGVTSMWGVFRNCASLEEAPVIPESVRNMGVTFAGCANLVTPTTIPENVTDIRDVYYNCKKLEGVLYINSTSITECSNSLYNTGIEGSGLTVVIPNDEVREKIIANSGYNATKVTIVKTLEEATNE